MNRQIKFNGRLLKLMGRRLKIGMPGPDFKAVSGDMEIVPLSSFRDTIKIITSFPSLDTPVCDLQVKEFNRKAFGLSKEVKILAISKDLPFAQQRFCSINKIDKVTLLSDYNFSSFGINYGVLIAELNLLARAVFILDKNSRIRYVQIVEELTSPPDYEDVLKHLDKIVKNPALEDSAEPFQKCRPCEAGTPSFSKEEVDKLMLKVKGWELAEGRKIKKQFRFRDFSEAKQALDAVSAIAEEQGHHPVMVLSYNSLKVTLTTHASGGLSENDFIMAGIIDEALAE